MTERVKYDWHIAAELSREASELVDQAMEKLHMAEALFRVDENTPSPSKRDAIECREDYDALATVRHSTSDRYHRRF